MSSSKIEFSIGDMLFIGEGEPEWLGKQLDKILDTFDEAINQSNKDISSDTRGEGLNADEDKATKGDSQYTVNLSTFLKNKNATTNQRLKFLATSVWLAKNKGNDLSTSDVTTALRDSHQNRLSNASDCLNRNVKQGYCEKNGEKYYVTPQGFEAIENVAI